MSKISEAFRKIDAFGEGIDFTIKGGKKFGTSIGAILTLLIYLVVGFYAQTKLVKLIYRLDTTHQSSVNENEIPHEREFSLEELQANFMFSLWSNDYKVPHNLTNIEDYVQFQATLTKNTYLTEENVGAFEVTEVPLHSCNETD